MFQTEVILFFQDWASPFLTHLMQTFTALGYPALLIALLAIILFGVDFKKGFVLLQIVLWTAALTSFFKNLFALPRPFMVDNRVRLLDRHLLELELEIPFQAKGASAFWGGLPQEVIDYYRTKSIPYGFPSGHTSMATTLWASLMLLFRQTWIQGISLLFILMVPFSRIYLGVHFLADVLGGYFLGFLILSMAYFWVLRPPALSGFLDRTRYDFFSEQLLLFLFLLVSPFTLLLLLPVDQYELPATILGINLGFILIARAGIPDSQAKVYKRVLRVMLAFGIYLISDQILEYILSLFDGQEWIGAKIGMAIIHNFLFVWASVSLSLRLGLFSQAKTSPSSST